MTKTMRKIPAEFSQIRLRRTSHNPDVVRNFKSNPWKINNLMNKIKLEPGLKWKLPPKIKIYEALGCLADGRLKKIDNDIRVYSSSRNKYYTVQYDENKNAIMANDNGSFWVGYLGYPSIAYLMKIGKLPFNQQYSKALKDIPWKDINLKNKNNFAKTILEVDEILKQKDVDLKKFYNFLDKIKKTIKEKGLVLLGAKQRPPRK